MFRFVDNATMLTSVLNWIYQYLSKAGGKAGGEVPTFLVSLVFVLWFQLGLSEILATSGRLRIC